MAAPSILWHLAEESLGPLVRKSWFKHEHVQLGDYLLRAQALYETGLAVGYACRNNLKTCVQLICDPGQEAKALSFLEKSATAQLGSSGVVPRDLFDLFFKPELERILHDLRNEHKTRYSTWSDFPKVAKRKLGTEETMSALASALRKGIAFGGHYPKLMESLATRSVDPETWNVVRLSLDVPETAPAGLPIDVRETEAIAVLRRYVEDFRADLLLPLGFWPQDTHDTRLRFRALNARQRNS